MRPAALLGPLVMAAAVASCELFVDGPSEATIGPGDADAIEAGAFFDAVHESMNHDARGGVDTGVDPPPPDASPMDTFRPPADARMMDTNPPPPPPPPPPCTLSPACMSAESTCETDCFDALDACNMKAHAPGQEKKCQTLYQGCETSCQTACEACAGCSMPMPSCTH